MVAGADNAFTPGEIRRAISRIDERLNAIVAVAPDVFAAEIRTQAEIHQQHRHAIQTLSSTVATNKEDLLGDIDELRGWLRWLFALLITNLVALLSMIVTAVIIMV